MIKLGKTGQKPQQILSSVALGSSAGGPNAQKVVADQDCAGLLLTISVTTAKGASGVYAASASVLSALSEILVQSVSTNTLHDFKTPNVDVQRLQFMFDILAGKIGKEVVDVAITADGTKTYSVQFWSKVSSQDFPLTITFYLASLSAIYSTTTTASASVTVVVTPIKTASMGQVKSQRSVVFALSGLTAIQNDVTSQMPDLSDISMLALNMTTEADLTDITILTPQVEMLSVPLQSLIDEDNDTSTGHITNFLRVVLRGARLALNKNTNTTTFKINESTADQPTIYLAMG